MEKGIGFYDEISEEQLSGKVEDTLLAHIERVVNLAVASQLCDSVYEDADASLTYLSDRLGITKRQALLFSLFVELSDSSRIDIRDLSVLTHCRRVRMLSLLSEDKALISRGLLRQHKDAGDIEYWVPKAIINALKDNMAEIKKERLSIDEFFNRLEQVLDDAETDKDSLSGNLAELVCDNMHLEFCKVFSRYFGNEIDMMDGNGLLFLVFAHRLVNRDDDYVNERDWEDYFPKTMLRHFRHALFEKTSGLLTSGLLEEAGSDGMRDNFYYRITPKAKDEFFVELEGLKCSARKMKELQSCKDMAVKKLYYNEREGGQIAQLSSLISLRNFAKVQQRLEECGMRKGFACLFYGAPGTGKTETVYQLARKTQRDLFVIDVAQIKSCWVGESEKNISMAFVKYRQCVEKCRQQGGNIPILLFNEADAVLGVRKEGATSAVDKMENSIQNIILQEMERLEGIMIATTNLTTNLDKAFERRFIYKIEFSKPSVEAKSRIWRSMIPKLSPKVALQLAQDYDFSGGQIENVARKRAVEKILSGKEPTAEQLNAYCRQEMLDNSRCAKIGF